MDAKTSDTQTSPAGRLKSGLLKAAFRLYEASRLAQAGTLLRNLQFAGRPAPDGLPIPPSRLRVLVGGTSDTPWFLEGGRLAAANIRDTLVKNGASMERMQAVLDFGCGCGRVLRHWRELPGVQIHGCDYNTQLIHWCQENLPFTTCAVNQLRPPLPYLAGTFDLVYALSVFTHLPEALQQVWMDELRRVLKPGGYLFFTAQGETYYEKLAPAEQEAFREGRLVVRYEEVAGTNLCSTFHPQPYVREKLAQGFELEDFQPAAASGNPLQDVVLLRKPASVA